LKKQEKLPAGPRKKVPLTFHQEKKRPTHGTVEGEKGSLGDNKTCVQTQRDDFNPSTDEKMQTKQLNSDAQAISIPTVLTKKGAIDTDKMHIYYWYATNIEKKYRY
jgi:hypothetical protein